MPAVTGTSDLPMFVLKEMSLDNTSSVNTSRSNLHSLLYSECEKPVTAESKFETIKSQLLKDGKLYEDDSFFTQDFFENIIVRRPKEICGDPKFYVAGHSRFDVNQRALSDCWFLAPFAGLAMNEKLVSQVVPQGREQSFEDGEYVGMFRFRFWRFGEWVEVIIDDRLPVTKDKTGVVKLIYNASTVEQEFWSPLLEKAYAKFHGMTYKAIVFRNPIESMQNLTGGLTEEYLLSEATTDLFTVLLKAHEKDAVISCSIKKNPDRKNKLEGTGLHEDHTYSVTKVMNVHNKNKGVEQLLRIRNPWGSGEWIGAWSDESPKWADIPDTTKDELNLIIKTDGEFWMSYEDIIKYFDYVHLCHLSYDSADPENQLKITSIKGKWIKGVSAGGGKDWRSISSNPQYMITLTEADEGNTENKCEIIVGLTQKDGTDGIGIYAHLLPITVDLPKPLDREVFLSPAPHRAQLLPATEKSLRLTLDPGSYVIIPFTEEPDQEDEFLLRVMSQKNVQITEYDGDLQFSAPEKKVAILSYMGVNFSEVAFNWYTGHNPLGVEKFAEIFNYASFREMKEQNIDIDVIKKIMVLAGKDPTAKLSFKEFEPLWKSLKQWQIAFKINCSTGTYDTIPRLNLRAALRAAGWTVNVEFIQRLIKSFDLTKETISFVDFINCILGVTFVHNKRQKASQSKVVADSDNKGTPKVEDDAVEK